MEIRALTAGEWAGLTDTFRNVFNSDLPNYAHGTIYGTFEDGKLKGFVLVEDVKFVGQIFVKEDKKVGETARKLVRFVREAIPAKQSVAAVASEKRFELLYKTLGMQEIPGKLFRRNHK